MNGLTKSKLAVYLLALFLAGGVTGWVLGAKTAAKKMFRPPSWEKVVESEQKRLQTGLNLTPEQAAKLKDILETNAVEMRGLFDSHMKSVKTAMRQRNAQIAGILNTNQQQEFERLEKERQDAWRKKEGGRSHHGGQGLQERGSNLLNGGLSHTSTPLLLTNSTSMP